MILDLLALLGFVLLFLLGLGLLFEFVESEFGHLAVLLFFAVCIGAAIWKVAMRVLN